MLMSEKFPSPYLRGADFEDAPPRVLIIKSVADEEVGKEREEKTVVRFHKEEKGLVLNKTNWRVIEKAYGDTDSWPGKPIELFGVVVEFSGESQPGIRCRIPKVKPAAKPVVDPEMNDGIPF
jgi:hypothetical protein